METAVIGILEGFQLQVDGRELILVGFGIHPEFCVMVTAFLSAARFFSAWTDARDRSGWNSRALLDRDRRSWIARRAASAGSLRIEGAWTNDHSAQRRQRRCSNIGSCRGIDWLLQLSYVTEYLPPATQRSNLFTGRPTPHYEYLFLAAVEVHDHSCLPRTIDSAYKTYNHFKALFKPEAVGAGAHRYGSKGDGSRRTCASPVWVCLPSATVLEQFVEKVDGSMMDGRMLVAKTIPVQSLEEIRAEQMSGREAVRMQRRARREMSSLTSMEDDALELGMGNLFLSVSEKPE